MAHSLTTSPITASQAGALDGFQVQCSCGFHATTSLSEREARNQGVAHVAYMAKKEAR
jgi:hypothetical protein